MRKIFLDVDLNRCEEMGEELGWGSCLRGYLKRNMGAYY